MAFMRILKYLFIFLLMSSYAMAEASPSREQIEAFKNIPKSQQKALIKQQGLDPSVLDVGGGSKQVPQAVVPTIRPLKPSAHTGTGVDADTGQYAALKPSAHIGTKKNNVGASKSSRLKRFGSSLFAGQPTTFAPVNDIPVPTDYLLGPGDQLNIEVYGNKSDSMSLVVDRNGRILIPDIGPVNVAGQTLSQAKNLLGKKIASLGVGVRSNITLGELRSFRIFVLGETKTPGSYLVSGMATMTHALYVSGGISDIGSYRNVQLKRRGKLIQTLDLYDLLLKGDTSKDVRLQPGDTLFIPVAGNMVSVDGAVMRPAIYELKSENTYRSVIQLAGGLSPQAFKSEVRVNRVRSDGLKSVELIDLTDKSDLDAKIYNGDEIHVASVINQKQDVISLSGAVLRPGDFPWQEGLTIKSLLPDKTVFTKDADLNFLTILRHPENGSDYEVYSASWVEIDANKEKDFVLKPRDTVFVYSRFSPEKRSESLQKVTEVLLQQSTFEKAAKVFDIDGHIRFPARYPLNDLMTLFDAISLAGGFKMGADTQYLLVRSKDHATGEIYFSQMDLESSKSFKVKPLDKIFIFNKNQRNRSDILSKDIASLRSQATSNHPAKIVKVSGQVKSPGYYPAVSGAKVSDLIVASGGLQYQALLVAADIVRYEIKNGQKQEAETIFFDLKKALDGDKQHDVILQPNDELVIKLVTDWQSASRTVTLSGEVLYPGKYTITPGETLQSVLTRAGGFTSWAEPKNAVFLRESLKLQEDNEKISLADEMEKNLLIAMKRDAALFEGGGEQVSAILTMGQTLIERVRSTPSLGRLVIDLSNENSSRYEATMNMELRDGDRLVVPKRSNEVLITGEVARSTSVIFEQDKTVEDYLEWSGGLTKRADADSIYVVHGDGSIEKYSTDGWFTSNNNVVIQPGDTIVVPADVDSISPYITWTSVSKILANLAVTAATLKTVGVID